MAFLNVAPEVTRPTALVLNLFVASIAYFNLAGRVFLMADLWPLRHLDTLRVYRGMIHLPTNVYKIVLGIVLALAALRLAWKLRPDR